MAPSASVHIAGQDPFTTGLSGVTYLGVEWVLNPIVRSDIDVPTLLSSVGGDVYPERRDELISILDIDTEWHMHSVSDGERRRVQLAMGLIRPWIVLLLDEITVDLDLLSRSRFLKFLRKETEDREVSVVYATHILDNLDGWPTHLVHMSLGRVKKWGEMRSFERDVEVWMKQGQERKSGNSVLGELILRWLEEDLSERGPRRGNTGKSYQASDGLGGYGQEKRVNR